MLAGLAPVIVSAALCALAAAGCTVTDHGAAAADPEPTATQAPEPVPLDLVVHDIEMVGMDNAGITGAPPTGVDEPAVVAAVHEARDVLERFLNAQLVDPGSRFGPVPIDALLTGPAQVRLTPEERAGLGQRPLWLAPSRGVTATATATVLVVAAHVHAVSLEFDAQVVAGDPDTDAEHLITQQGQMVFVPTESGWRAQSVDVTFDPGTAPAWPAPLPSPPALSLPSVPSVPSLPSPGPRA